jgi:hypothetical protein
MSSLTIEENKICDTLVSAIVDDVKKTLAWKTEQKDLYISFVPSPPNSPKILRSASEKVPTMVNATVSWRYLARSDSSRDKGGNEIYAVVNINHLRSRLGANSTSSQSEDH